MMRNEKRKWNIKTQKSHFSDFYLEFLERLNHAPELLNWSKVDSIYYTLNKSFKTKSRYIYTTETECRANASSDIN